MALSSGMEAPDFELRDQTGKPVRLSDYLGKKAVVLVFYPFTFSGTCEDELCSIRDQVEQFQNDDVETLAVSVDSPFAHRVWAEQQGYTFPILSDFWPHGAVAQTYGIFNEHVGAAERATFIIDRDGVIRYAVHNGLSDARDQQTYLDTLRDIGALPAV
jgi:mycoredoxin-dependent peroxiredoxin